MKGCYAVDLAIRPAPEGGWSIEVPGLQGCHVEGATLEAGLADIQEAVALILDLHLEEGGALPASVRPGGGGTRRASLPVVLVEHPIRRPRVPGRS